MINISLCSFLDAINTVYYASPAEKPGNRAIAKFWTDEYFYYLLFLNWFDEKQNASSKPKL